jgi:hypothetical protein
LDLFAIKSSVITAAEGCDLGDMFLAGMVPEYRQLGDILAGGVSAK